MANGWVVFLWWREGVRRPHNHIRELAGNGVEQLRYVMMAPLCVMLCGSACVLVLRLIMVVVVVHSQGG